MTRTRKVVIISMGTSTGDYELDVDFLDTPVHIERIGCNGRIKKARFLVEEYDGKVDAIGLGGMSIHFKVGDRTWRHQETYKIAKTARKTPVVGGRRFKAIVEELAVRELARQFPELLAHETIHFMSGITSYEMSRVFAEYTQNLSFADPVLHFGVPYILDSMRALHLYAMAAMPYLTRRPYKSFYPEKDEHLWRDRLVAAVFDQAEIIVGDHTVLNAYTPENLTQKVIITNTLSDSDLQLMRRRGVRMVVATIPAIFSRPLSTNVLEAMVAAVLQKSERTDEDYKEIIERLNIRPVIKYPQGQMRTKRKFAFLIQPQRQKELFAPPVLQPLKMLPYWAKEGLEWMAATVPPMHYAKVQGIRSEKTGVEAEGWIIAIGATPKQLALRDPDYAYAKAVEASKAAARLGARILGLGAFSKPLASAGGAISKRSRLPITTGDSYTASVTLWAVNEACRLMEVPRDRDGRIKGRAMIIGALDPVGTVAARLLPLIVSDLVLADTKEVNLEELRKKIIAERRDCRIATTLNPREELGEMDLVVMVDFKKFNFILDEVNLYKPGAIVCDSSEPPAIPAKLSRMRPDIMVVRSGLVELPGPVSYSKNIGLAPKTGYASMAEAAILALEGRFESFSHGAEIDIGQVREIYKLGLKHGFKLAAVQGPQGVYTDSEIALIRTLARERLAAAAPKKKRTPKPRQKKE